MVTPEFSDADNTRFESGRLLPKLQNFFFQRKLVKTDFAGIVTKNQRAEARLSVQIRAGFGHAGELWPRNWSRDL